MIKIDLNCDLGETQDGKLDEQIMPYISSCNIACGGHFGDEGTMEQTILLAKENSVSIGAHPSFPDKENFGREVLDISLEDLRSSLESQLTHFLKICDKHRIKCQHVKPHGALYNEAAKNEAYAKLIVQLIQSINPNLKLYGLADSLMQQIANQSTIEFVPEAFADRAYEPDKTLMSRKREGAVLQESIVLEQILDIAKHQKINAAGKRLDLVAKTICLHSDTQGAVNLAKTIHQKLVQEGIEISPIQ